MAPAKREEERYESAAVETLDTRYDSMRLARPDLMPGLRSSIERHGVLHPIVVNRTDDALVVLDGFKRVTILRESSKPSVPVRIVVLEETQAKAALVTFNAPHRGLHELEEAWVVASLVDEHGLLQTEVAALIGRHKSWVCRRLRLAKNLEGGVVDDMRLGLVSATVARELARLPRGNQPPAAEAIRVHRLSSRQSAELVSRLLSSDDKQQCDVLLADPLRFLAPQTRPSPSKGRDPRLSGGAEKVRRHLVRAEQQAVALLRTLRWQLKAGMRDSDFEHLQELVESVKTTMHDLIAALVELLEHTGIDDA